MKKRTCKIKVMMCIPIALLLVVTHKKQEQKLMLKAPALIDSTALKVIYISFKWYPGSTPI